MNSSASTGSLAARTVNGDEPRVVALDWMRGIAMVLMVVDHASLFFNAGRVAQDSAALYTAGTPLPLGQLLLRWVTHLCAPTFLFLAGAGLALGTAKRKRAGVAEAAIRRDLLMRGALIAGLDLIVMSAFAGHHIFQVLYAIGLSMILMAFLRLLRDRALLALALSWFALGEGITGLVWDPPTNASIAAALTVARHAEGTVWIFYPVVPWLAMMMLGWVFGRRLDARGNRAGMRSAALWGLCSLAVFAVVRGLRGYGNMWLQRQDGSLQQWLHVSKYPPSLTYSTLELGLMGLCLAGLMALQPQLQLKRNGPLLVFGQTALFFYLAHFGLLNLASAALGLAKGGAEKALAASAVVLLLLYPVCRWFRSYKRARPSGWVRFI